MASEDSLSIYDDLLPENPRDPWLHEVGEAPVYSPDHELLGALLARPVRSGEVSQSGRFAKGVDAWVAAELRRSGFGNDEVWPRRVRPRVLPADVATLVRHLPSALAQQVTARLASMPAVAPTDARVLGRAYAKQVDVVMSRWDRGPEILISTKAQLSSFGKNLPNRFEEAYGDAGNLRGRHPLAATGYVFVQRASILVDEPDAFERSVDMVRKLRDRGDGNGYTATCLLLVDWDLLRLQEDVAVLVDPVPPDVQAPQFFVAMVQAVLDAAPVTVHVRARELRERRSLPV